MYRQRKVFGERRLKSDSGPGNAPAAIGPDWNLGRSCLLDSRKPQSTQSGGGHRKGPQTRAEGTDGAPSICRTGAEATELIRLPSAPSVTRCGLRFYIRRYVALSVEPQRE
jgi:hypothetical protein